MARGYMRMSRENQPGNESNSTTLTTKKIFLPVETYTISPAAQPYLRENELVNTDLPRQAIKGIFNPNWAAQVGAYPDALGYLLTSILGAPTTTQGDGSTVQDPDTVAIPSSGYRHVWTTPGPTGLSPVTTQHDLAYTDEGVYFKVRGAATQTLALTNPRETAVMLAASGPALYAVPQSDPSLTAAFEADSIAPFMRRMANLSWLASGADPADFSLTIANPCVAEHHFGSGSRWPSRMYKGDTPILVTGSIPMEVIDESDHTAAQDATAFTATLKYISETIIGSSYPYKFFVTSAANSCQMIGGGPNALTNVRRRGAAFDFRMFGVVTFTLINATASYL